MAGPITLDEFTRLFGSVVRSNDEDREAAANLQGFTDQKGFVHDPGMAGGDEDDIELGYADARADDMLNAAWAALFPDAPAAGAPPGSSTGVIPFGGGDDQSGGTDKNGNAGHKDPLDGPEAQPPPGSEDQSLDDLLPSDNNRDDDYTALLGDPNPMDDGSGWGSQGFPPGFRYVGPGVAASDDPEGGFDSPQGFPPGLHHINPYSIDPTGGDAGGSGYSQGQAPPGVRRGPGAVMPNPEGGGPEGPAARVMRPAARGAALAALRSILAGGNNLG